MSMTLDDFNYDLPEELIAQEPVEPRDSSRLMIVDRKTQTIKHDIFRNFQKYLSKNDLLVFNNSKVFPARLRGTKESGGKVEVLLLKKHSSGWEFIGKNIGKSKKLIFSNNLVARISQDKLLEFSVSDAELFTLLEMIGETPVPPYIHSSQPEGVLRNRYQTVYAKQLGSAAAPTAGLHFTPELLQSISYKADVTLHVGLGTFLPIKSSSIEGHTMHSEWYQISDTTLAAIKDAKDREGKVVAVGTTTVRTLESWQQTHRTAGETNIFIYPGYSFQAVDGMITNFHLPQSTLLLLVAAFAGKDFILHAYKQAVDMRYRFFSFGDAMLIV